MALTQITRDDIVRAGACAEGVKEFCEENGINFTAVSLEEALELVAGDDEGEEWLSRAAELTGDGDGYGGGGGDGYGDGDGGDGYGDGDGDGDGGDGYGGYGGYGYGEEG